MKISKAELIEMHACKDGLKRFIRQTNNTDEPVEVVSLIDGQNTVNDLLWLAGNAVNKDKIVRFACDCALINIELIKPYTDKYDFIVEFLRDPSADAARSAYAAARSAYAAAAARSAADAADAAAAARSAADAADAAAARSAADAADAADDDAAYAYYADAAYAYYAAAADDDAADASYASYAAADAAYAAYAADVRERINVLLRELFS